MKSFSLWSDTRTFVAIALSILSLAEIVDLTIVTVALPHIMGALSCNINEVSLTMTSYIVAAAVFIPLTGFVSRKFGAKKVSLVSALIFGIASALCGLANSLSVMVILRLIQGVGGAFLPSMSQFYINQAFNDQERPKIMIVYILSIVMGPIIGPMIGGAIVEHMSWRWIFYINVPLCIFSFVTILFLMKENKTENIKTDYISFIFMVIGAGFIEFFLDEGNNYNWFSSKLIVIALCTGIIGVGFFIWRGLIGQSVVNFGIFKSKNFVISCTLMFFFMMVVILDMAYFPTLLQQAYGYPVDTAGYIVAPRGICAFIGAPIVVKLSAKVDPRKLILIGFTLFMGSGLLLCSYGSSISPSLIIITSMIQGFGMIGAFINIVQASSIGVPHDLLGDASGIFNFFRNIGNSVGTSISATMISRLQQVTWNSMSEHISKYNPFYTKWGSTLPNHISSALKLNLASQEVQKQSFILANIDVFYISIMVILCLMLLPMCLDRPKGGEMLTMH